jgi:ribonuclease G
MRKAGTEPEHMMTEEILINVSPILTRVARVFDGELIDFSIEPTGRRSPIGNIYLGRVLSVVPTLRAAFVDVGLARDGFLSADDARELAEEIEGDGPLPPINQLLREGDSVLVQVARDALGDKGARLATSISLPGRTLIYSPYRSGVALSRRITEESERERLTSILDGLLEDGEGVIVRTNAAGARLEEFSDELEALREVWRTVLQGADKGEAPAIVHADLGVVARAVRDYVSSPETTVLIDDADAFSVAKTYAGTVMPGLVDRMSLYTGGGSLFDRNDVEDQVAEILEPSVPLPGGGQIIIETTAALTAIDVDSKGRNRGNPEEAAVQTNIEAAEEVGRQLRLRGIGGAIVVDFIQMRRRANAERVIEALRSMLQDDPAPTDIGTISRFGLLEMTRRRAGPQLSELISRACPACDGLGQIDTAETAADHAIATADREVEENPGGSLTIIAAPDVISAIERAANAEALGRRLGCAVTLRRDEDFLPDHFDVVRGG